MERVEQIRNHPLFVQEMHAIEEFEKNRIYCGHGMEHLIATARIACLLSVSYGYSDSMELFYAAAMLHDLGRARQYQYGAPHNRASAELAIPILKDCGFSISEIEQILDAISEHRDESGDRSKLGQILYEADKKSRLCFCCTAQISCKWSDEKKNLVLTI